MAIILVTVLICGAIAGTTIRDARRGLRSRDAMGAMRQIFRQLEVQHAAEGRYPCPGSRDAGECAEVVSGLASPVSLFDPWGNPYILAVTPDGSHAILVARGSDGAVDEIPGGPFMHDEEWRDIVMLDGSFHQFPEGRQCGPQPDSVIRELVLGDRARGAKHWRSEEMTGIRALHGALRQQYESPR